MNNVIDLTSLSYLKQNGKEFVLADLSQELRDLLQDQNVVKIAGAGSLTNSIPIWNLSRGQVNGQCFLIGNMFEAKNEPKIQEVLSYFFQFLALPIIILMADKDAFESANGKYEELSKAYKLEFKRENPVSVMEDFAQELGELNGLKISSYLQTILHVELKGPGQGLKYFPEQIQNILDIYIKKIYEILVANRDSDIANREFRFNQQLHSSFNSILEEIKFS